MPTVNARRPGRPPFVNDQTQSMKNESGEFRESGEAIKKVSS